MLTNRPCPYRNIAAHSLMDIETPKSATSENSTAAKIDDTLGILSNKGVAAVEALIIADVPWMGTPIIKQLWEIPFGWVASYFVKASQNGVTFAVIDLQVGQEESELSEALKAVVAAEKSGDPLALKKAIQDYANAQSSLTHSDGSHHATG